MSEDGRSIDGHSTGRSIDGLMDIAMDAVLMDAAMDAFESFTPRPAIIIKNGCIKFRNYRLWH